MVDDEEKLFSSITLTPIATVITNPRLDDNPIVAMNRAFCELTGYSEDEVLGRNCRLLAGPETDPEKSAILRNAVAAARPALTEMTNYRRDGSTFWNAVMIAPLFDDSGTLLYFIGSQMDIGTAHGALSERRIRAKMLVDALTDRQRQVLAQMTKGLRNKQIANALGIEETTVKMHRQGLLQRLGVATTADAVRIAVEAEL